MAWVTTDSIKGPKGDKGDRGLAGTITAATAESVTSSAPASVEMTGTASEKQVHFKIPRGLPGVNAVENDIAVAAYVKASDSATRAALNESWAVVRRYNSSSGSYPARIADASNIFFGSADPGLLMQDGDYWANPESTTLATVAGAMLDPSSALYKRVMTAIVSAATNKASQLYAAIQANVSPFIDMQMHTEVSALSPAAKTFGSGSSAVYGYELPKGASTSSIRFNGRIPTDWARARLHAYWVNASGSGDVRLGRSFRMIDSTGVCGERTSTGAFTTAGALRMNDAVATFDVIGGTRVSGSISRISQGAEDTLTESIGIIGVALERLE